MCPADQPLVRDITICTGAFSGNRGEVCVDFAPMDGQGREILSEHAGTHLVRLVPGFTILSGPGHTWTIGDTWRRIAAVLNHWPPEATADRACSDGRCEHDDRLAIGLR